MAQRTIVQLTDDLDGKLIPAGKGETIRFSLDRTDYEIDLADKNAKACGTPSPSTSPQPAAPAPAPAAPAAAAAAAADPDHPWTAEDMTPRRFGPGPNPRASRSASAAASPPNSSPNSRPPPREHCHPAGRRSGPGRTRSGRLRELIASSAKTLCRWYCTVRH